MNFNVYRVLVASLIGWALAMFLVLTATAKADAALPPCNLVFEAEATSLVADGYKIVFQRKTPEDVLVWIFQKGPETKAIAFAPGSVAPDAKSLYKLGGQCTDPSGIRTYARAYILDPGI